MSDTPRTDEVYAGKLPHESWEQVAARLDRHARDLERENAKLREERDASQKKLSSADREIERLNLLNRMLSLDSKEDKKNLQAITQLRTDLAAANERAERAEQELVNISRTSQGVLLTEAQDGWHKSQMKYLEMTERCRVAEAQSDALRKALEVCQDALTYGGDRLVVLINSERSKCKGDHWDFWDYLAEKLRLAITAAKSALGQK